MPGIGLANPRHDGGDLVHVSGLARRQMHVARDALPFLRSRELPMRLLDHLEDFAGTLEKRLPSRRHRRASGRPHEERPSELVLERLDRARDVGLRMVKRLRRAHEALFAGNGKKKSKGAKVHVNPMPICYVSTTIISI